jgi:hypothetical protein
MSKFKKGNKVRIIRYGHLQFYFDIESLNNFKNLERKTNKKLENLLLWGDINVEEEDEDKDYSDLVLGKDKNGWLIIDNSPYLVGKEGIIKGSYFDLYGGTNDEKENNRRKSEYSIIGIPGKSAWYDEEQLELI